MFGKFAYKLDSAMEKLTRVLSTIGSLFLMLMTLILVAEVIMRAMGSGVLGSYEIVELAMVPLVFLSMAHVQSKKRNIAMDLIYSRLPKISHPFLNLLSTIASIILFSCLVYAASLQTMYEHRINDLSAVLYIPIYPFMALEVFGFIILILVLIIDIMVLINRIAKKQWDDPKQNNEFSVE